MWLKKCKGMKRKKERIKKSIHFDASVVEIDDLILEAQLINSSFSLQKGVQYSTAASQLQE